jgi:hypothetical protein
MSGMNFEPIPVDVWAFRHLDTNKVLVGFNVGGDWLTYSRLEQWTPDEWNDEWQRIPLGRTDHLTVQERVELAPRHLPSLAENAFAAFDAQFPEPGVEA